MILNYDAYAILTGKWDKILLQSRGLLSLSVYKIDHFPFLDRVGVLNQSTSGLDEWHQFYAKLRDVCEIKREWKETKQVRNKNLFNMI